MSTKVQAILDEIKALPPVELRELYRQFIRLAPMPEKLPVPSAQPSDEEFEAALDEVTGCTVGSGMLQRLLEDRRRGKSSAHCVRPYEIPHPVAPLG